MTRRQRTMLFSGAAALFFVISPAIILYAIGYRADLANHRLLKTGGISLTASPQPVNAYVDGTLVGSNNFIVHNIFVANLLPKNYRVEIAKDGYYPWQKTLQVAEGQVAEALNIILFPKNPQMSTVASHVSAMFASPDGSRILFVQSSGAGQTLVLSSAQQPVSLKILSSGENIQQIFWATDNSTFLIWEKTNGTMRLLLGDASNPAQPLQDLTVLVPGIILAHADMSSTQLSPDKQSIYFLSSPATAKEGVYILHLDIHSFEGPVQTNVKGFVAAQDGVYTLSGPTGLLAKCSFDLTSCTQVSSAALPQTNVGFASLMTDGDHIVVLQDKNLYVYQPDQQNFSFVTDSVNAIMFSPDKQKMTIQKDHEVSVYWFKDITRGEKHKQGDLNLLLRISEKISGIAWLNDPYQYLAVEANDALRIVELDGRDTRNIVSYQQFSSNQQISWQNNSGDFVLLHGNTLLQDFVWNNAQ